MWDAQSPRHVNSLEIILSLENLKFATLRMLAKVSICPYLHLTVMPFSCLLLAVLEGEWFEKTGQRLQASEQIRSGKTSHYSPCTFFFIVFFNFFMLSVNTCTEKSRISGFDTLLRSETLFRKKLWKLKAKTLWGLLGTEAQEDNILRKWLLQ